MFIKDTEIKDVSYLEGYREGAIEMADFLISEIYGEYLSEEIVAFLEDKKSVWFESNLLVADLD